MGFISRKVLPVCGNMCICCPALRSRSRQPVKRYKKLLAEIFPKSLDGPPNDRKIMKLCEYAARNPFRIPKIAKYLEQRIYKELRYEHLKFINIVMVAYNKLLCVCKGQMAYFAVSLLNVVVDLLDYTKQSYVQILGCQTLTEFIYSQTDGTYTHNLEGLVHKVCNLTREAGEEHGKRCLRASSLQCLSAMVWFMAEFSHIFDDFDEIVHVTLDNYETSRNDDDDDGVERGEPQHNWVDEVVRSERSISGVGIAVSPDHIIVRPRPEKKDRSLLTSEEIEMPKTWAQICIQKMVELAKESTTMRRVLDPIFIYFDTGKHWIPGQGLAVVVLSDMSYFMEDSGNEQLILAAIIRHLDHKNVGHDLQIKSDIIQIGAALARQLRSRAIVTETGIISDLCRHLRKSLQATVEVVGQQESNLNISLQNSVEDCLLEIVKGIDDVQPLFDIMAISLENLPPVGVLVRATIGSLLILAHIVSLASVPSHSQQAFPDSLLLQLLKAMIHPDAEVRIGGHHIFSALLVPRHGFGSLHPGYQYESKRWQSTTASAFASATALFEKLRKEKDCGKVENHGNNSHDSSKEREISEEDWKQGWTHKNSPNIYKISSAIIDKTAGSSSSGEAESRVLKLSEDQTAQLLSAFWVHATLPDNLPSNFEAIAHSFCLTLISSRLTNPSENIVIRFFQLPLSLRNISLDPKGIFPPSWQRSLFTLATAMLMFAAKIYNIHDLNNSLKLLVSYNADPYMSIGDDLQLYIKPRVELREYGSVPDHQVATSSLSKLRMVVCESDAAILDILVKSLSSITKLDMDEVSDRLLEAFTPDDAFMFGPQSILDLGHLHTTGLSKDLLSFDGDFPRNSLVEDDVTSELSVPDLSRYIPKAFTSPSVSHIISVGQLIESALEVAGQVAGTSVSTSPLPYRTVANQCETFGTGTRKKLSTWLAEENSRGLDDKLFPTFPTDNRLMMRKVTGTGRPEEGEVLPKEPWMALKLPPASPFDNFLKAARC